LFLGVDHGKRKGIKKLDEGHRTPNKPDWVMEDAQPKRKIGKGLRDTKGRREKAEVMEKGQQEYSSQ